MLVARMADGSPQAERLERMKTEFLVAQQRRRDKSPHAADHPVDTDDDPLSADERADGASAAGGGVGTLEPCN